MAMKMAVESMEILPGVLPRPGRVPEQRILSPETWLRCDGGGGTFLEDSGLSLGFLASGQYIGERAEPGAALVGHTPAMRGQGPTRAWRWCGPTRPPPGAPFWLLESYGVKLCKIVSFSNSENIYFSALLEPKTAENRYWHFGILSIC
jgi:hypothetical protein